MTDRCDSCGDDVDDLVTVQRLYVAPGVSPDEADAVLERDPSQVRSSGDIERWCFPCRTMYPHEVIES
ncbi:MAG: hypothetical protein ABI276_00870 [Acidimicrobiales bacterium]